MIGEIEMTWTAILERNGEVTPLTFTSGHGADEAYRNIHRVTECDGYRVVGLLKGDQANNFYSPDENGNVGQTPFKP